MTRIPLIGASVVSVQLGAAIAASLFERVGAPGTVLLRQGFAAVVLLAIDRPRLRGRMPSDWLVGRGERGDRSGWRMTRFGR